MLNILMGPTGKIIKGHVLDVHEAKFNEALRHYDDKLYTKWNPNKCGGFGCWEIRRRPEFLSALDVAELDGNLIFKVGPKEYDMVHHVLDCAFLNYDAIRKLKEIDCWQYGTASQYQDEVDRQTRNRQLKEKERRAKELSYMAKHYKAEIRAFMEHMRSGVNPHSVAAHWDSVKAVD